MTVFRSRHQVIVSMALVATLSAWPALIAQDPTPPAASAARDTTAPHPRALCFRERPMPECSGFTLVELMGAKRLAGARPYRASFGQLTYIGAELGGMVNRGSSHAIGATMSIAAIDPGPRASVAARYRMWDADGSYRDFSLGLVGTRQYINEAGSGGRTAYGVTTEVSAGYSVVSVWLGADAAVAGSTPLAAAHVGLRLGSYGAVAASVLAVLAAAVVAGSLHDY